MFNFNLLSVFGVVAFVQGSNGQTGYDAFKITPFDYTSLSNDNFGISVGISGNTAVAGAYKADENGAGNGGSIYIYERDLTTGEWIESITNKVYPNDVSSSDYFGKSVSIYENMIIVGSENHDFDDDDNKGGAYIYSKDIITGQWSQTATLIGGSSIAQDNCGYSVSISKNSAIVGCYDGRKSFIFEYDETSKQWSETGFFSVPGANRYGESVSIYNNKYAIVGDWGDDEFGSNGGIAYIYKNNKINGISNWSLIQKLNLNSHDNNDYFGKSVSICNDFVIIGATGWDYRDENGVSVGYSGGAIIFKNINGDGSSWIEHTILVAGTPKSGSLFGNSVSLNCDENNYYTVVGAEEDNTFGNNVGTAYVYKYDKVTDKWSETDGPMIGTFYMNGDRFGTSLSVGGGNNGDCWISGVPYSNDYPNNYPNVGAAFIFCPKQPPTPQPTVPTVIPTSVPSLPSCDYKNKCTIWGDPHYTTFDGTEYHFQGEGYFYYVKNCDSEDNYIPFTILGRQDKCRGDYTCVEQVIVQLDDIDSTRISFEDNNNIPIFISTETSAIGDYYYTRQSDGTTVSYSVGPKSFEILFIYNGDQVKLKFSYSNNWLDIETTDCLSGDLILCGLCGNINDDNTDDFTRCDNYNVVLNNEDVSDTFEGTPWINTHLFGESCCSREYDFEYYGISDCGDDPICPPGPDPTCLNKAEIICNDAFDQYCSCNGEIATIEWTKSCAMDMCALNWCNIGILNGGYNIDNAVQDGCLDTVVTQCILEKYRDFVDIL